MKYLFFNDYSEGAHPDVLAALSEFNLSQESGYGDDIFCKEAADLIKQKCGNKDLGVHFVSGGTQANLIVLAALLRPYESVVAPSSGHISVHEAGAIEATGHKINVVESKDGKIYPKQIRKVCAEHPFEHMVMPRVVFVSQSTEVGTIYSKSELEEISKVCRELGLYLYLDGARLGSALMSSKTDMNMKDVAELVDVFYVGGTKNGALLGEAVVFVNRELEKNFRYHLKQRGALLAKGRVLGIQFRELFKENLYFELAGHANEMAGKLSEGIKSLGYEFLSESPTNQIFPIFPNGVMEKLKKDYGFYEWEKVDEGRWAVRLVTSWATKEEAVDGFLEDLRQISAR